MKWNYFNLRTLPKISYKNNKLKENHGITEEELIKQEIDLIRLIKNQIEVLKKFNLDSSSIKSYKTL